MLKPDEDALDQVKDYLKIRASDPVELDNELVWQAQTFGHVGVLFAMATAEKDKKKHDLDVLEAQLDRDIRDQLVTNGERVTEDKVKAGIKLEQVHQRAYDDYLQARFMADKWEAVKEAYKQRAYMLREIATLRSTDYFGEAVGAGERQEARQRSFKRRHG